MNIVRALAALGIGYWLVRKFGERRRVSADGLDWEDAHWTPSNGKVEAGIRGDVLANGNAGGSSASSCYGSNEERHGAENDKQGNHAVGSQPFGESGPFGSHAPYADDPTLH